MRVWRLGMIVQYKIKREVVKLLLRYKYVYPYKGDCQERFFLSVFGCTFARCFDTSELMFLFFVFPYYKMLNRAVL